MLSTSLPAKFPVAFASGAGTPYVRNIPVASQIGITPGAASLVDGFPPLNFIDVTDGGVGVGGDDMNGILRQLSQWAQFQAAGGVVSYDAAFQTAISGYPMGAHIGSVTTPGLVYRSVVEDNLTNPDAGGAGWTVSEGGTTAANVLIGSGTDYWGSVCPPKYVFAAGQTLSRSTYSALFAVMGTMFGAGDGSTTFGLPDKRGRVSVGLDNMGGTAAGRVTPGISGVAGTVLGAAGGDQSLQSHGHGVNDPTHDHSINNPAHDHSVSDPTHAHGVNDPEHVHSYNVISDGGTGAQAGGRAGALAGTETTNAAATGISIQAAGTGIAVNAATTSISANAAATGITIAAAGGGESGNLQPSIVCNYIIYAGV